MNFLSCLTRIKIVFQGRFKAGMLMIYNMFLSPLPNSRLVNRIRIWTIRSSGCWVGQGCRIEKNVRIEGASGIKIGNGVWICSNVYIQCGTRITIGDNVEVNYGTLLSANCGAELCIGDNCHIAHMCSLKCSTMKIDPLLRNGCIVNGDEFKDINIGTGSWIGAGAIILPGVKIGAYNVVAAGAVVTKDSPDGVLVAGVPAIVKKRYLEGRYD